MDEGRILQVRLSPEAHDALKKAAQGVRLESRSALIRAFADAISRKSVKEVRTFLFFDEDELPPRPTNK